MPRFARAPPPLYRVYNVTRVTLRIPPIDISLTTRLPRSWPTKLSRNLTGLPATSCARDARQVERSRRNFTRGQLYERRVAARRRARTKERRRQRGIYSHIRAVNPRNSPFTVVRASIPAAPPRIYPHFPRGRTPVSRDDRRRHRAPDIALHLRRSRTSIPPRRRLRTSHSSRLFLRPRGGNSREEIVGEEIAK